MQRAQFIKAGVWLVVLALVGVFVYANLPREDYQAKIVMSSAANLAVGGPVWVNGFEAGSVMEIETRDGKAVVTAGIAPEHAPLHAGTKARITWYAALGERILSLDPGPDTNAEIPDGGLLEAESSQVEVDQVLAALDTPTRENLNGMIRSIEATTSGKEPDVQAAIQTAGPTVKAAGAILDAVGKDGPAIRALVTQLQGMIEITAQQQDDIRATVVGLDEFSGQVATSETQLAEMLRELPPTLETANATLRAIPPAVNSTTTLLEDLHPATRQLPGIAEDLNPFMDDLRPAVNDLGPVLWALRDILADAPDFFDNATPGLSTVGTFLTDYQPAVSFLRPYTPETVGWLQNWSKNFGAFDSQGHLWAAMLGQVSPQAFNEAPATAPPLKRTPEPKPGEVIGQPWEDPDQPEEDANGSPMQ